MKIGQVTMCGDNYGACLQAYAMQYICKKNKNEIELIRYDRVDAKENAGWVRRIKELGLGGIVYYLREYSYIKNRKNAYIAFREKHIHKSPNVFNLSFNLNELNKQYDMFICGSDMIWSEEFQEDWDFFFLNFASKEKSFSYAPSFGKNTLLESNKMRVKKYLESFSKVTCREEAGVELVRSISDIPIFQVLDPTMLLTKSEWEEVIGTNDRIIKQPFVFMYLFGKNDSSRKVYINDIEKKYGKAYKLPFNKRESRNFPIESIGPIEYIRFFRDAEFIITDTFHGLMFALIFNKPFVVLDRNDTSKWAQYSDRMTSTLKMFDLYDRYIYTDKMFARDLTEIDYKNINQKIAEKREESLSYLMEIVRRS